MADEELLDDEVVVDEGEAFDDAGGSGDDDEAEQVSSSRSRRGRRSNRGKGSVRAAQPPREMPEPNWTVMFVVGLLLGPLGVDRFMQGEPLPGILKLVLTVAAGAMMFAGASMGLDPLLVQAIMALALAGMLAVYLRDVVFYFLNMLRVGGGVLTVYCGVCGEEMEMKTDHEAGHVVCRFEECSTTTIAPDKNVIEAGKRHSRESLGDSLLALTFFLASVACLVVAYAMEAPLVGAEPVNGYVPWPEASVTGTPVFVAYAGTAVLLALALWKAVQASREKPLAFIG